VNLVRRTIFFVPGQPQGKGRARVVNIGGHARAFTPEKTASYESLIKSQYYAMEPKTLPLLGEVDMSITAIFDIPKSTAKKNIGPMLNGDIKPTKKPDADNIAKVICDALNGIAYSDDTQIVNMHVKKIFGERPGVRVEITGKAVTCADQKEGRG
jgi:Holliday junction resolvase RusA-like endonuclease